MRMPLAMMAMVLVWGGVSFGTGAPMQARIVDQAKGAPNLASTLNQGAYNLGNAIGASLGGLVLTGGYGYTRLPMAAAAVAAVGFGVAATRAGGRSGGAVIDRSGVCARAEGAPAPAFATIPVNEIAPMVRRNEEVCCDFLRRARATVRPWWR